MSQDLNQKIYVAGHRGMVGSAIMRNLQAKGHANIALDSIVFGLVGSQITLNRLGGFI